MYEHKDGVSFRKVDRGDLWNLLRLKNESWWGTHGSLLINIEDQERWLDSLDESTIALVGVWQETHDALGFCLISNIDWQARVARIAGSMYPDFRNAQFSRPAFAAGVDYAFEILNLHRLDAEVLPTNYPAQVLEIGYLGFQVEGNRRKAVYKCGRYYDSIVLGLLREDWLAQERVVAYGGSCHKGWNHEFSEKMQRRAERWRNG